MRRPTSPAFRRLSGGALLGVLLWGTAVGADPGPSPSAAASAAKGKVKLDLDLDLQDIVLTALKTKVKVTDAPAIITVITEEQFKPQRFRNLYEAIGYVPGFMTYQLWFGKGSTAIPTLRGLPTGPLIMRDGLDVLDATLGAENLQPQSVPLEAVKRIETVSGPGGVMWGSNAMLGVVNVISKTADDLNGVEAYVGGGAGDGSQVAFRGYVMGGMKLWKDRLKVFAHLSYDLFKDPALNTVHIAVNPATPSLLGTDILALDYPAARTPFSNQILFSGNAQLGPLFAYWNVPWSRYYQPNTFYGATVRSTLDEDGIDCTNPANKALCAQRVDPFRTSRYLKRQWDDMHVMVGYRQRFLRDQLGVTARAFFMNNVRRWTHEVALAPSSAANGGASFVWDLGSYRVGGSFDGDWTSSRWLKLLYGGEVFLDYMPEKMLTVPSNRNGLWLFPCPPGQEALCPTVMFHQMDRLTSGVFLNAQSEPIQNLFLDAGVRGQFYGGKRTLEPRAIFSGAVVWRFLPEWTAKVNYAEGFRPPALYRTETGVGGGNFLGDPNLKSERSRAIQGEVNARLLQNYKEIRSLGMRFDYSYTWISNFIDIAQGKYSNVGKMGLHSAEVLLSLALKSKHNFTLGYTFLDGVNDTNGAMRTVPNQWFSVQSQFNLWRQRFFLASNMLFFGSAQDPNRVPGRSAGTLLFGDLDADGKPKPLPVNASDVTDVAMDRIPPTMIWNAGLAYIIPKPAIEISAHVYNLLNNKGYYPGDAFAGYNVIADAVLNPRVGTSFFASLQMSY